LFFAQDLIAANANRKNSPFIIIIGHRMITIAVFLTLARARTT
jgi:hypothetical protein